MHGVNFHSMNTEQSMLFMPTNCISSLDLHYDISQWFQPLCKPPSTGIMSNMWGGGSTWGIRASMVQHLEFLATSVTYGAKETLPQCGFTPSDATGNECQLLPDRIKRTNQRLAVSWYTVAAWRGTRAESWALGPCDDCDVWHGTSTGKTPQFPVFVITISQFTRIYIIQYL